VGVGGCAVCMFVMVCVRVCVEIVCVVCVYGCMCMCVRVSGSVGE